MKQKRKKAFEYIYLKADEAGYMGMDSIQSGKFQDELENDPNLALIAGEKLDRNYIKDTILNNYSKKQRYISEEDVRRVFTESDLISIEGTKKDLENGIFSILYKENKIRSTCSSIGEWQTVFKRFGRKNNDKKFAFLTCGGVKKAATEINQAKDTLNSYGIDAFIVKPNENPISIDNYILRTPSSTEKNLSISLSKPFLLLAGISGTGKSRFVRQQALPDQSNYQLVAVRPDWHEPSDLLGYVSRLSGTAEYVSTPLLGFIVRAWQELLDNGCTLDGERLTGTSDQLDTVLPFWLCLDEMNLAPVEQYFADYLALIETREWHWPDAESFEYSCNPLLVADTLKELGKEAQQNLATKLGLEAESELWQHFIEHGIAIPPNLIVAGTVNMDETTHGFSRKVIDRAMTFDFGEFFPNDLDDYYAGSINQVSLTFPRYSSGRDALPEANAQASIQFLQAINAVLKDTPFELAYRALNELLLAVHCHTPNNDADLQAVWDDFLMQKVLPRIEGDADKLQQKEQNNLLTHLQQKLEVQLDKIWDEDSKRTDFYRTQNDQPMQVPCRSRRKLQWMQDRLESSGFTSFWP